MDEEGENFRDFLEICQEKEALSKCPVFVLSTGGVKGKPEISMDGEPQLAIEWYSKTANGHLPARYRLRGIELDAPPHTLRLQPWECIQTVVTSMHGRDIAHRIGLTQDNLIGMPISFRQSTRGGTLQTNLQALRDRAKALELAEKYDDAPWNELHWDFIRLRAEISKHAPEPAPEPEPTPATRRPTPSRIPTRTSATRRSTPARTSASGREPIPATRIPARTPATAAAAPAPQPRAHDHREGRRRVAER